MRHTNAPSCSNCMDFDGCHGKSRVMSPQRTGVLDVTLTSPPRGWRRTSLAKTHHKKLPMMVSTMTKRRQTPPRRRLVTSCVEILLLFLYLVTISESAVVPSRSHAIINPPSSKSKLSATTSSRSKPMSRLSSSHSSSSSHSLTTAAHPRQPPWMQGLKNSVASSLAAATSKIILAPFDTIKTLQQNVRTSDQVASLGLLEAARIITSRPRGFWELYVR